MIVTAALETTTGPFAIVLAGVFITLLVLICVIAIWRDGKDRRR